MKYWWILILFGCNSRRYIQYSGMRMKDPLVTCLWCDSIIDSVVPGFNIPYDSLGHRLSYDTLTHEWCLPDTLLFTGRQILPYGHGEVPVWVDNSKVKQHYEHSMVNGVITESGNTDGSDGVMDADSKIISAVMCSPTNSNSPGMTTTGVLSIPTYGTGLRYIPGLQGLYISVDTLSSYSIDPSGMRVYDSPYWIYPHPELPIINWLNF